MTTLTATAIISAVDRASAVFARVGANAQRLGGRFSSASAGVARLGQSAAMNLGMPAAFAGALAARGEYEVDRIARTMQAVGELTDAQREMLTGTSFDVSMIVGQQAQDLIRAQKELIQGGLDPETTAALTEDIAKVAKTNEMALNEVAEMGINAARGMGMAFETTAEKVASIREALNFMTVVPAASTENVDGLRESLKYAAPIAGMLKIRIEELGAALSILADRGFKGEEGGTAFRTILLRGIAPTKQLATAYRAAGIELSDLYQLDETKLKDMQALRERVLGAGIDADGDLVDRALKKTGAASRYGGLYEYQDSLMANLSDALGIGPGDAQNKGILKKVIDQHIFSAIDGFDLTKFFTAVARLPLSDFAKVAGIQRSAQAQSLKEDIARLAPLKEKFTELMPGAIDRQFAKVGTGFSHNLDRIGAAFGKMRHSIFDSGVGTGLTEIFTRLANSIDRMSRSDPGVLNALGLGVAGLVAAPAAGAVIWGISASLGALGAVLASPALAALVAGGGLAAVFGDVSAIPFGEVFGALGKLGGEVFSAAGDLFSGFDRLARNVMSLLGVNVEGSLLASGFRGLAAIINGLADAIATIRGLFDTKDAPLLPNGSRFNPRAPSNDLSLWNKLGLPDGSGSLPNTSNPRGAGYRFNYLGPPGAGGPVQVQGQAEVTSKVDVHVTLDPELRAQINKAAAARTVVPLNTGVSMPDAAPSGAGQ